MPVFWMPELWSTDLPSLYAEAAKSAGILQDARAGTDGWIQAAV